MIAAASHCLAAKLRGGRREESHGQVGRWSRRGSLVCNALIMQSLGILTVIKPNLWARKLFQQAKNSLSETWERCFNKTHKNSPINQKIENNSSSEDESFSDSGFSDLSSDGELLETESESCIQTKSKITRIQQKKLLMCSAHMNVKKMLEENGKDIDRYIEHFQSFLSLRKGK